MKIRTLFLGMVTATIAHTVALTAHAEPLDIKLDDKDVGVIEVSGPHMGNYQEVRNKPIEYFFWLRSHAVAGSTDNYLKVHLSVGRSGEQYQGTLYDEWTRYRVTTAYYDSRGFSGPYLAPIRQCNERLKQATGAAREEFLFKGATFTVDDVYPVHATVIWPAGATQHKSMYVPVKVRCLPLNQSPLRTTLRVEPAKIQQMGKFLCPMELKLHGYVATREQFYGKAIFVGPHYLSAMTTLNLQKNGSRNVSATYDMNWQKTGGFTTAPSQEPKKQKLTFHFHVSKDNKTLSSASETVEVSCKKIKVAAPVAGDEMTIKPAN